MPALSPGMPIATFCPKPKSRTISCSCACVMRCATVAMPPLRLFTSTVFQLTEPGYFTSRITRPNGVT